jgi:competence protein ComEA
MQPRLIGSIFAAFGLGLGAGLVLFSSCGQAASVVVRFPESGTSVRPGAEIRVYVTGAVHTPGVYTMHDGDRIVDAVEVAGGPSPDADTEAVNFAQRLHDEGQVHVPRVGESASDLPAPLTSAAATASVDPININRADANLLRTLPGIGSQRADGIIASRQRDGALKTTDELVRRRLLPQSVYEEVKALIVTGP